MIRNTVIKKWNNWKHWETEQHDFNPAAIHDMSISDVSWIEGIAGDKKEEYRPLANSPALIVKYLEHNPADTPRVKRMLAARGMLEILLDDKGN